MRIIISYLLIFIISVTLIALSACSTYSSSGQNFHNVAQKDYAASLPSSISTNEKVVMVDPRVHAWGAYGNDGSLIKAGLATAGGEYCPDTGGSCRTSVGSYRIYSLGSADCISHKFPLPNGGAPMPYCMYFNGGQGLHGSGPREVVAANVSHGCVRMQVADAEWLRFNFVNVGTKVIVRPY